MHEKKSFSEYPYYVEYISRQSIDREAYQINNGSERNLVSEFLKVHNNKGEKIPIVFLENTKTFYEGSDFPYNCESRVSIEGVFRRSWI